MPVSEQVGEVRLHLGGGLDWAGWLASLEVQARNIVQQHCIEWRVAPQPALGSWLDAVRPGHVAFVADVVEKAAERLDVEAVAAGHGEHPPRPRSGHVSTPLAE